MQPVRAVALVHLEERLERLRVVVHRRPRVAVALDPSRDATSIVSSSGWIASSSSQRERRRHLRARPGAHAPRAEHRLVRRVLVEVDEDALAALLLPPRGGDEVGPAALELARHGDGRGRAPRRSPSAARGARRRGGRGCRWSSGSRRCRARRGAPSSSRGRLADVREVGARLRVEVDAQLVGVLGVGGEVRPHVEAEAAEVDRPHDVREVGGHERPRRSCRSASETIVVSSQSGAESGTRFWKNDGPPAPFGNRCRSTGRPPIVRISGSATRR